MIVIDLNCLLQIVMKVTTSNVRCLLELFEKMFVYKWCLNILGNLEKHNLSHVYIKLALLKANHNDVIIPLANSVSIAWVPYPVVEPSRLQHLSRMLAVCSSCLLGETSPAWCSIHAPDPGQTVFLIACVTGKPKKERKMVVQCEVCWVQQDPSARTNDLLCSAHFNETVGIVLPFSMVSVNVDLDSKKVSLLHRRGFVNISQWSRFSFIYCRNPQKTKGWSRSIFLSA